MRFAIDRRPYFEVMFRPELVHADDPDLQRAESRSAAALHRGSGEADGGGEFNAAALAAWSLAHGFAELLIAGNFPRAVKSDPEAAFRAVAKATGLGPE